MVLVDSMSCFGVVVVVASASASAGAGGGQGNFLRDAVPAEDRKRLQTMAKQATFDVTCLLRHVLML